MAEDDLPERVTRLEQQVDSHEKRITAHGLKIDSINESVVQYHARTDEKLNTIGETVNRIDHRLEVEEARPAENWRAFVKQVAGYVLAAVAAVVLMKVGLSA